MKTSRYLSRMLMALASLLVMSGIALAADPGLDIPLSSEANDQKAGSILYFNAYTSSAIGSNAENTRISITNTNANFFSFVHMFFVDGSNCSIADNFLCLTPNQTTSFLASDLDPGVSGYIVAVSVDAVDGLPSQFNYLIGDEYVKFASGHSASLGAIAFAKLNNTNVVSTDGSLAALFFDGLQLAGSYNRAPRVVAVDNIPARADGNDTMLIINRVGGNLGTGAATLGSIFGLLYNDAEVGISFTFAAGVCQFRSSISNGFPRTAPRFETHIPAGRSGWLKLYSQSDIGIVGAAINYNANSQASSGAFNSGHNLHHLTLTSAANLIIPVFPPTC